jgi:hypothetical protein
MGSRSDETGFARGSSVLLSARSGAKTEYAETAFRVIVEIDKKVV